MHQAYGRTDFVKGGGSDNMHQCKYDMQLMVQ